MHKLSHNKLYGKVHKAVSQPCMTQ